MINRSGVTFFTFFCQSLQQPLTLLGGSWQRGKMYRCRRRQCFSPLSQNGHFFQKLQQPSKVVECSVMSSCGANALLRRVKTSICIVTPRGFREPWFHMDWSALSIYDWHNVNVSRRMDTAYGKTFLISWFTDPLIVIRQSRWQNKSSVMVFNFVLAANLPVLWLLSKWIHWLYNLQTTITLVSGMLHSWDINML